MRKWMANLCCLNRHKKEKCSTMLMSNMFTIKDLGSSVVAPVFLRHRDFQWQFKLDAGSSDLNNEEWKNFSDVENDIIEDAKNAGKSEVEIDGDHIINIEKSVQYLKNETNKQDSIKRLQLKSDRRNANLREERFSQPITLMTSAINIDDIQIVNSDLADWSIEIKNFPMFYYQCHVGDSQKTFSDVVEEAAQGIIDEGTLLGKQKEAEWLSNQLLTVKHSGIDIQADFFENDVPNDIGQTCVYLYTKDSFLYRRINSVLRSFDTITLFQVKTLGPFCWLLYAYLMKHLTPDIKAVYRGVTLTDEQRLNFMKEIDWSNLNELSLSDSYVTLTEFVSTTRNRALAEIYGNTLFVIRCLPHDETPVPTVFDNGFFNYSVCEAQPLPSYYGINIESMSNFPEEEEFLMPPGTRCRFEKYEYDAAKEKHIIYLECFK